MLPDPEPMVPEPVVLEPVVPEDPMLDPEELVSLRILPPRRVRVVCVEEDRLLRVMAPEAVPFVAL